ncbi:MAG: hypothetical protein MRJ93_12950 [Nitrososphaeraceae archaeon]|nr:hypothetical protein [Nitrososphaeraceae archaeon]
MQNESKPVHKYKYVALSDQNYQKLKSLGRFGERYNDVLTRIFNGEVDLSRLKIQ